MTDGGAFFDQFIEDYFTECEEHLATTRRALLTLESGAGADADPAALRDLHRSLHTLKGLSGMVGDGSAERVSHAMEDALRGPDGAARAFDAPLLDALFAGADLLERCVSARRTGEAAPDVTMGIAALSARRADEAGSDPGGQTPSVKAGSAQGVQTSSVEGSRLLRFEFVPSVELTARGVGVDVVRARLRAIGTLIDAKPRIVQGGVAFDFTVAVQADSGPDDSWLGDGMRWTVEAPARIEPADEGGQGSPAAANGPLLAAPGASPATAAPGSSMVRVDLARLNGVMRLVGDLVVSRSRLDDLARLGLATDVATLQDRLEEINAVMERQVRRLRESVMRIRLVPVGEVFERLRFAARDAIRESGKEVKLVFHGQTTELDKLVVDRMLEPLLHLVRNAVSHGIETPERRRARGKPDEGTLTLSATADGDRIHIDVEDDGGGIDVERVAARAREMGLLPAGETLATEQVLDLLCAPGFSTRDEVDRTSGRGIGMDVVRSTVRALAGELSLVTRPGLGTHFAIQLPLTLMILDALLVEVGGQQMAVPQPALREILQIEASAIIQFESNDVIAYRGTMLPLVRLARLFDLPSALAPARYVLVVGTDSAPVGLLVDRLNGLREIVVHPVVDPLVAVPGIAGATELGDGRVSLILDAAAVVRLAHEQRDLAAARPAPTPAAARARAAG